MPANQPLFSNTDLVHILSRSSQATAIYSTNDLIIEMASDQMISFWGKDRSVIGKPLLIAVPELEGQPFIEILQEVLKNGITHQAVDAPAQLQKDGKLEWFYYDFTYTPIFDNKGRPICILHIATDVTSRNRDQIEIQKSKVREETLTVELEKKMEMEHLLRNAVESAPFPIGVYRGPEMRIVLANQMIKDVWGKGNDLIGKTYSEVLPELEGTGFYEQLAKVYETGIPVHARNQPVRLFIDNEFRYFYFNYSFTPVYDLSGGIYGVMNTAADVTDLELSRQKVESSQQTLQNMILQAPVAMCILLGPKHVITIANDLIIELWGKPAGTVINRPVFEALPDARGQGLEEMMDHVYLNGETCHASEMPVQLMRNGKMETVYQNFVYQPYRDVDNTILGVIVITTDITEQILARQKVEKSEAELREVQKRLESELEAGKLLQRQKDDFIGIASHELKTPLTSLTAIIQLLNRRFVKNEDAFVANAMSKANTQVKKMNVLINGFLNVSRLESGKSPIRKQRFPFEVLLKEIIDETRLTTTSHELILKGCPEVFLVADREQISAVISNLLNNAVKYSPGGKEIEISCHEFEDQLQVSVRDYGIGILEEDLSKLFDRYYRVESEKTTHISGFGIGLYLCAEIIHAHGGRIWAESTGATGSTFHFVLPVDNGINPKT